MNEKLIKEIVESVINQTRNSTTELTLEEAKQLIECVEAEATKMGMSIVVAVSNASGRPIAIHCMDHAFMGSFDVALNKTYTSTAFQMPTSQLAELAKPGASLYGVQFTNEGKVVIIGGGEPLFRNGKLVGALGVSGGSAEKDTALAAYGKQVFEEVISR